MKLLLCFSLLQAQHFIKFSTGKLSNNQRIAFSFNFKELKQRICIDLGMKFLLIGLHYRWDFQICLKDLHLQLLHFFFFFFLMWIRPKNTAKFWVNYKWREMIVCKMQELGTCMREAAAGIWRLKCFCLCFCCTFRAKPEPRIPCGKKENTDFLFFYFL